MSKASDLSMNRMPFGILPSGESVELFTFILKDEIEFSVMNHGATLTHLKVKDRFGKMGDVVMGFDNLEGYVQKDYLENYACLGATVGRVAGRVRGNQFSLNGKTYKLKPNGTNSHIHGGLQGWDKKLWNAKSLEWPDKVGVLFSYTSLDGEENYPGNVEINVSYTLDINGLIEIFYEATTDQPTPLNPTNHTYFNLSGNFQEGIEAHELRIAADQYLPLSADWLPTGELQSVDNSPFDFRNRKTIKTAFEMDSPQLELCGGIDHCLVLSQEAIAAELYHPGSGRLMQMSTSEPGVQVYTANNMSGAFQGKQGVVYGRRTAICLETQHFPNSHNQPNFPSIILHPGSTFKSKTTFQFSVLAIERLF